MATAARLGEVLQLLLGHPWVVLELQGLQRHSIAGRSAHPTDEQAFGGPAAAALPGLKDAERLQGLAVERDAQFHVSSVSHR
jgi:hypothetical protein